MKARAGQGAWRLRNRLIAGILLTLGVIVRFGTITKASIWHDEGFSVMLASQPLVQIWQLTARDVHPPGYYMLLHLWMQVFGRSELAVRGLSMLAGVGIIVVGYLLVKRIAGARAGLLALLFLALAPFLVRYTQEARMYGLLGLLMIGAVYAVVRILETPKKTGWYVLYGACVLMGLYTHYFTVLAVGAIWLFVLIDNRGLLTNKRWWLANILAVVGFLPWAPSLVAQLTRGQGLSWLAHTTWRTAFDTVWQFMSFTDGRRLPLVLYVLLGLGFVALMVFVWWRDRSRYQAWHLLVIFAVVPLALAIVVSVFRPIFHERYFMFCSIGFYMLLGIAIDQLGMRRRWLLVVLTGLVVVVEIVGLRNVISQSSHQMRQVMQTLNADYMSEDKIISGELYAYFDGSYYNRTGTTMQLYTPTRPNGYGESSLLYQKADQIYIDSWALLPAGSRVWVVGKTGSQSYYEQIPASWQLLSEHSGGYSEVRLYQVQ